MKREKQLLIVEDDEELRNTIVNSLNRTGLRAFGVSSLRDARARLRLQTYDLVLIDIHLGDDR
ncbi:response regulator, partial [Salmonella enterica]|uniref:response regulator n=1 Tax=Salmonella enterica TaxID=28901 RepID=UPI003D2DD7D0